jgi:hypothetical protein
MLVFFFGVLLDAWLVAGTGGVGIAAGIIGWFAPAGETQET